MVKVAVLLVDDIDTPVEALRLGVDDYLFKPSGVEIRLPPLRQRREGIPLLARPRPLRPAPAGRIITRRGGARKHPGTLHIGKIQTSRVNCPP